MPAATSVGENPWATLRATPWVTLMWADLPEGVSAVWEGDTIVLDNRLGRVERRCALMHELVHAERGIGYPAATRLTMEREEAIVRAEAAVRLVPAGALARFVAERGSVGPVSVGCVAAQFDVTQEVAAEAIRVHRQNGLGVVECEPDAATGW